LALGDAFLERGDEALCQLGALVAQHVGFVVNARNALAGCRVPLPLPPAERELSNIFWIAQHFADARVHPTGTSSAPSSRLVAAVAVNWVAMRRELSGLSQRRSVTSETPSNAAVCLMLKTSGPPLGNGFLLGTGPTVINLDQ